MAAKSQHRLSGKGSKSGGSNASLSAKGDGKGRGKKVTIEDEGEDKDAMAFKILSSTDTNNLMSCTVVQIESALKERFGLNDYQTDLKQAATLDFYTSAVYWGIQQKFTAMQLSGFFTVVHTLFENVKDKQLNMVDNLSEMKKMFVGIGLEDVKSNGLDFFTVDQTVMIGNYIHSSFFQHYKLFLYMFSHSQAEEIIGTDLQVEVANAADVPFPPPLDEGVSEDMFTDYIATPPATPVPDQSDQDETAKISSHRSRQATPKSRASTSKSKRGGSTSKTRGSSRGSSRGAQSRAASSKSKQVQEEDKPDLSKELEEQVAQSDLFSHLTADDVREVVESLAKEMLGNLQNDVGMKLREKENQIIQRINKVHKVAE